MAPQQWNPTDSPGQKLYRAPVVTIFFVLALILWLLNLNPEGTNGWVQRLHFDDVSTESFLTSHLFHESGLHLVTNSLVILLLGMILESRWGTPKFLAFYFSCAWGSSSFCLIMARSLGLENGYTCGAASVALGCLVSVGFLHPDTRPVRWLPPSRYLVWVGIFVCCGVLVLVERHPLHGTLYLLPQAIGVPLALAFLSISPWYDRWLVRRRQRFEEEQRLRVREIRSRVDRLLEKISAEGYESLSPDELHFLRDASKHYRGED